MHHYRRPNRHRFIYLVRHGQYVRTERHPHGELTELGRRQAAHLAERLADTPFDAIWSSTMSRAEETAQIIADAHVPHLEVNRSTLLREKIFPCDRLWEKARPQSRAPADRLDRIEARWLKRSSQERHELIVCHGNLIRAIVTRVLGLEIEKWPTLGTNNCGLTRIVCRDDGNNRLLSYNEFSYLPDEYYSVT